MTEYTCNVCGRANPAPERPLTGDEPGCRFCGAHLRARGLLYVLSLELFGTALTLPEFPRLKSARGLGTSDSHFYAGLLEEKFDYRNTFYDREPRFDITNPPAEEFGKYDFITSSEVFEHVLPPVETAFQNACRLLKPGGVLVLTVPYSLEPATAEHFPDIRDFGFAQVGGKLVMVRRTPTGSFEVIENPVFHVGCSGNALELREFSEEGLKTALASAGFSDIRIHAEDYPEFGIVRAENWSLPISARRGPPALGPEPTRELLEQWRDLNRKFHGEMNSLNRSFWFRLGRKLRLL